VLLTACGKSPFIALLLEPAQGRLGRARRVKRSPLFVFRSTSTIGLECEATLERVAQLLVPTSRGGRVQPRERPVEVNVGQVQNSHCALTLGLVQCRAAIRLVGVAATIGALVSRLPSEVWRVLGARTEASGSADRIFGRALGGLILEYYRARREANRDFETLHAPQNAKSRSSLRTLRPTRATSVSKFVTQPPRAVTIPYVTQRIEDVLHRRGDLSTFVVHLTRNRADCSAFDALVSIYEDETICAYTPMGRAAEEDDPEDSSCQSQRVVCFSETPLEHIYSLVADIEGRRIKLEPYGIALTKMAARRLGVNPVWYVDMTPGRDWEISAAANALRELARTSGDFHNHPAARILPFIEGMGTWPNRQKEFWWEREWRHVSDMSIPSRGVVWLCPEEKIDDFEDAVGERVAAWVDPRWGLEQIIAHLARVPKRDVTPFSARRDALDLQRLIEGYIDI
jgi:hypothetical protein